MELTSPSFAEGEPIPPRHTCDGTDTSPRLTWSGVPAEAASLALICDDPDAPAGTWVHWVCCDIPSTCQELPEAVPPDRTPAFGGVQGTNDFRRIGYGGPCPPGGTHRYVFKLYAVDAILGLSPGVTKRKLLQAMEGHVLAQTRLIGTYSR